MPTGGGPGAIPSQPWRVAVRRWDARYGSALAFLYRFRYTFYVKPISFLGDSLGRLRDFPADARSEVGYQLSEVQLGNDPDDWKPMKSVGAGVREIRVREASGAFRVIYLATLPDRVLVLHAFEKKAQQTPRKDVVLAARRLRDWKG